MLNNALNSRQATLRRKILGVKIRHARIRAGLTPQEIGEVLGVASNVIEEVEFGRLEITLPQLEVMALYFNVPIIYFLSDMPLYETNLEFPILPAMALRQRVIGVLLRQVRIEASRSHEDLAKLLGISPDLVVNYEMGQVQIPLQQLETLARYLNVSLNYFLDQGIAPNDSGGDIASLDELAQFSKLPGDVREFLANPANLLYTKIAMSLSGLSADTLRALAEGLLEVTY